MRRTLHVATLLLACAGLAPACLLDTGALETSGSSAGTTASGGGGTGGIGGNTGGTGGTGGAPAMCGNGSVEPPEKCDDGNLGPGDGCDSSCHVEDGYACAGSPSTCEQNCGDGKVQSSVEGCDDANSTDGDGCSDCQIDDGYLCAEPGDVASVCVLACGNGVIDTNAQNSETCDDRNTKTGDGCYQCAIEPGWMCSGPSTCAPVCGDGILIAGEEACDDGDTTDAGGCNATCMAVTKGWYCNDATTPMACHTQCGDGIAVDLTEVCDDGNKVAGDGCSPDCQIEATCGNGIVDPGEECDGGTGCTACKLDAISVCGKAIEIPPGAVEESTGARTSFFQSLDSEQIAVATDAVPAPGCSMAFNLPVLHRYVTGARPSMVTVEALQFLEDGTTETFKNTVVWMYRDCPNETDIDGCDNDGAMTDKRSLLKSGYIPAQTTLFIALSGEGGGGGGDKGKYRLRVTEQPVKLVFSTTFSAGIAAPFTASDLDPAGGDGYKWLSCDASAACGANDTLSRSGGPYALASDNPDHGLHDETLRTGVLAIGVATKVFVQYNFSFVAQAQGGVMDTFALDLSTDGMAWAPFFEPNGSLSGRRVSDVTAKLPGPLGAIGFRFNDDGKDSEYAAVDDVYVFTY
jgi:cysteine-rich repeat protein